MKNMRITAAVFVLGAMLFGATPAALAQDKDSVFEEITVTATKREKNIYEVPVAMSNFSAETIERQGITDLIDIGKFVPNLSVTGFSAGHTSSANPFIRGIGLQDHLITTDPGVSVYVDGVYLGRQVGQNWSLSNIERVEVLRGPQGTLYGRNSIGGAVNIITKAPGSGDGTRVAFKVGSRGRGNADFYSDMNLTDTFAVSLTGAFKRRDGLGKFLNIPDAEADVGETKDISARVDMIWRPNDDLSFRLTADGNDGDNGLRPYQTLIDEVPTGAVYAAGYRNSDVAADPYDNNTGQANQVRVTNEARGIALTVDYDFTDELSGKFIVSDRSSEYESGLDDDGFSDDFLSFPEIGTATQTSIELQLSGEYDNWDFIAGVYSFEEEGANDQDPTIFLGGPGDFLLSQKVESFAVFGNVGYQLSDNLRLSGGLRHTSDDKDAAININSGLIDFANSRDWSETSWEVALSWELDNGMTTYGTIQNGYQSGQFEARPFCLFGFLDFTQPGNVSTPNCFFGKDNVTAVNYEVGIKGQPTDNLSISVAVFTTDYSDLPYQVSETTATGFSTSNVIVDQTSTGLELEGSWAVTNDFLIHGTLGLIDVDVDDPNTVAPLTPETTASLSPEYSYETNNGGKMVFRADWSFRDDMEGQPAADPATLTSIDSRSLLNFDVSYESPDGRWLVALYGYNVTDERYVNAKLNVTDYILEIYSNDASEFGLRYVNNFF